VLVKTQVVPSDGDPVDINYLMHIKDGSWRIIDVHLKGRISEVATRRGEFASVIRSDGIDGLLDAIERKIEQLRRA
jgi:phospholipid transport system substrate-binding protein